MSNKLIQLQATVEQALGEKIIRADARLDELTIEVSGHDYHAVCHILCTGAGLQFEQLMDLCGVDYSAYKNEIREHQRFVVVLHLLSVSLNHRIRLKVVCDDDEFPVVASVTDVWSAAAWYEREAFDFYGIVFEGNDDLRRILTDYGFIGHPFRKDFPLSGYVEMRYDPEQKRVVYQPVTIEPRELTPRIVREEQYGGKR